MAVKSTRACTGDPAEWPAGLDVGSGWDRSLEEASLEAGRAGGAL